MDSVNKHLHLFYTSAETILVLFIFLFSGCSDDNPTTQITKAANPIETRIGYISTYDAYYYNSIIQRKDGGYACCGSVYDGNQVFEMFVARLSADYQMLWSKKFGLPDSYVAYDLMELDDGSIAVAGNTSHYYPVDQVICVLKVSSSGALLWSKSFSGGSYNAVGHANRICKSQDNCIMVTGSTDYGSGTDLLKIDQNGVLLWARNYGNLGLGKLISAASGYTSAYGSDIVRLGNDGTFKWHKHFSMGMKNLICGDLFRISSGDFIIPGSIHDYGYSSPVLIKTDDNANVLWAKTYGPLGWGELNSVNLFLDGGYIAAGGSSYYGVGGFFMRFSEDGDIVWAKAYDTTGLEHFDNVFPVWDGGITLFGPSTTFGGYYNTMLKCNKDGNACENQPACQLSPTAVTLSYESYTYPDSLITLNSSEINMNVSEAHSYYNNVCNTLTK